MNSPPRILSNRTLFINGFTEHIHDPTEGLLANRNRNRRSCIFHVQPALKTISGSHRNGSDDAISQLLLNL